MTTVQTKKCPYCAEDILEAARKCKHCGSVLDGGQPRQEVVIKGMDPFAEYHTDIQGKKQGRLTAVGMIGVGFGICTMVLSGLMVALLPGSTAEEVFATFLVGLGFAVASYLWARRPSR